MIRLTNSFTLLDVDAEFISIALTPVKYSTQFWLWQMQRKSYALNIGKDEVRAIDRDIYVLTKLSKHIYYTLQV